MKLAQKLNPKNIFGSRKKSRSVSRSEPPSFSSGSSSDGSSTNLKAAAEGSLTPTTVLPTHRLKKPHEISEISASSDFLVDFHFDLVQAFKYMDRDGDGKINRTELETLLLRVGADPLREEDLSLVCDESDGCVSLEKFGEISSSLGPACGTEIRDTFDIFDVDHDGKISAEELLGVFLAIGDNGCTLEDCKRMIAGVDSDGDGFVCFEDFSRMMEHQRC